MEVRPSDIRYTQDSIKDEFQDGRKITDVFRDLLHG